MVGPPTSPTNLSSASDTEVSAATATAAAAAAAASAAAASAADIGKACCCDSCIERRFVCQCLTVFRENCYHNISPVTLQVNQRIQ